MFVIIEIWKQLRQKVDQGTRNIQIMWEFLQLAHMLVKLYTGETEADCKQLHKHLSNTTLLFNEGFLDISPLVFYSKQEILTDLSQTLAL